MTTRHTEQKYLKLLQHYGDKPVSVTLQELADVLFCTRRHMRNLLLQMQEAKWLIWQSQAGRGHRARLHLRYKPEQLLSEKAEQLLESGHIDQAIQLLGKNKHQVAQLLRSKLGYSVRADYQRLCIPYYRTMPSLCPGIPLRRSEQHLVRQIFSGLTRINEEKGEVEADPLTRSAKLPLFSHLQTIQATGPLSLEITLAHPDNRLPLLLSHIDAMILPPDHTQRADFPAHPVGTGPYEVVENNGFHLQMKAFDHYFGLRGLLDEVEVFIWPNLTETDNLAESLSDNDTAAWLSSSLSDEDYVSGRLSQVSGKPSDNLREMFLERGGYFLLCDSRSPHWHTAEHRRWLRETLSPYAILQHLSEAIRPFWVPGGSLLSSWFHTIEAGPACSPFISSSPYAKLRLAYHDQHPEFPMLLDIMQEIMRQQGILLEGVELNYDDWANGKANVDLWLGTVNFPIPEEWNVGTWLLGSPLLRHAISGGDDALLAQWETQWHAETISAEQLVRETTRSGWLQPLFHHWMRLKSPDRARGIHLNNLGWFDFRSTWIEPGP
ncbi:SgrR family transcriptional regulator [Salmonella enterica]|uniref:SgrR family transcriptional regulator n=1 Tax=Salmonella enterica TaxID=28901 RepID=UPI000B9DF1E9|nr:SgrR family transcriptional regulator [Salmonella enterica]OZH92510.1 SgrR family transcriptional regulator [Salmonella enterica subsp. enterica serovar Typhimurium]